MKNPPWSREELILALDLYFRLSPSKASPHHPEVVATTEALHRLHVHAQEVRTPNFRSPASVGMKLCNFRRLDPDYHGVGLKAGSKGEISVWNEFSADRERLARVAKDLMS
ncbi:MAG: hypothetical protein JW846_04555 [Dehalococcoidia bacterium]|nr:hypothetical protein [Dehalococcoidia bacterium]